jgi:hypothetical protein
MNNLHNQFPSVEHNIGAEMAQQQVEQFAHNPGLAQLTELYGLDITDMDTEQRLAAAQGVATTYWNYRRDAERQAASWATKDDPLSIEGSEQWNTVFSGARELGLVESSKPHNTRPDYLVVLGGANRAPLDRLRYGLESVEEAREAVVYLGSARRISDAEKIKAADYAPGAETEFDLGVGAIEETLKDPQFKLQRAEGPDAVVAKDGQEWRMRTYYYEKDGKTRKAYVCSTPPEVDGHRATTYDNFRFFAQLAHLGEQPDTSVVAVTTGLYTAGQHLPAVQELTLPHGTTVETIGHDAAYAGMIRTPDKLVQETKAAIDAAIRLQEALRS